MVSFFPSCGLNSLRCRLLLPIALLAVTYTVGALLAPSIVGERVAYQRLRDRAVYITFAVISAGESASSQADLQTFVDSLGSGSALTEIVAVGGTPARVVASTNSRWINTPLTAIDDQHVVGSLQRALEKRETDFDSLDEAQEYACATPVPPNSQGDLLRDGAVLVQVDSNQPLAQSDDLATRLGFALVATTVLLLLIVGLVVQRNILAPLERLKTAVEGDLDLELPGRDEIALLSRVLNSNRDEVRNSHEQLRAALAEVEAFRTTLERHSIISMTDPAGKIIDVNDRFCAISGYEREELIGKDHRLINSGLHNALFWKDVWATIRSGSPWRGEICNLAKDGSLYWVDSIIAPFCNAAGEVERYVSIRNDITARKLAEHQLVDARRRAEDSSKSKSEFLANMSHEIRTPLTAILGYSDILDTDLDQNPIQAREALKTIRSNADSLLTVINDILDVSKIEAGQLKIERLDVDPRQLLEEVVETYRPEAMAKGLALDLEIADSLPRVIKSDPTRLKQILLNLVSNAVKFTERGSVRVRVGVQRSQKKLTVDVEDTGIGMSKDQVDTISRFEAFTQADTSTTRRFGGTGLGLRICNTLAVLLGGRISIRSDAGRGSCFTLSIDVRDVLTSRISADLDSPTAPDPVVAAPAGEGRPLEGLKVLLAEDGHDNQRLITYHLREAGAEVEVCDDGELAVASLDGLSTPNLPHLVLMDMQMPKLDGYDATRRLREMGYTLPVVALTAHAMNGDRDACLMAGCNDYLSKPLNKAVFLSTCVHYAQAEARRRGVA